MPQHVLIGPKRQLADMLNLSERRITDLVMAGVLPARGPHGFDLIASVRGYVAFLKTDPTTLKAERLRLAKVQADILELQLGQRRGELVLRRAVADREFRKHRQVRDSLENIPSRVAGLVAAESSQAKCFELLRREVQQALEGLCDGTDTDTSQTTTPRTAHA
jgi:phage terminase Nu1 subunit (DNA packaging protein)